MFNKKIKDTNLGISKGSRADFYWRDKKFSRLYLRFRQPTLKAFAAKEIDPYNYLLNVMRFKGLEFGNWVNANYRFNYAVASCVAFYDINKVLRFDSNLGFNYISLAFGARGAGRALAHYEARAAIINITRFSAREFDWATMRDTYIAGEDNQDRAFLTDGGVGALAHEYGHALDYYFGEYIEQDRAALPNYGHKSLSKGWQTTAAIEIEDFKPGSMRGKMNEIIFSLMYANYQKDREFTTYYSKLRQKYYGKNDYWLRHNELWARLFEQYIAYRLDRLGITNMFLTQRKYESAAYADKKLFLKVLPLIDELITLMRKAPKPQKP